MQRNGVNDLVIHEFVMFFIALSSAYFLLDPSLLLLPFSTFAVLRIAISHLTE